MNVFLLNGRETPAARREDAKTLGNNWKKPGTVFLLQSEISLYEYIDGMLKSGEAQYTVRICKELTGLDVDYYEMEDADADSTQTISKDNSIHAETLSELLSHINPEKDSYVTVNGDIDADKEKREAVRAQLGEIVQQLVYLQLPLNKIRVRTAQEMKDAEAIRVFEKRLNELQRETRQAIESMNRDKSAFSDKQLWEGALGSLQRISEYLKESTRAEMKIAVAATKKTGKSVIVNSIIEQELAPTSLEQATPNNCVYRRREDEYTLRSEGGKVQGFGPGPEGAARLHAKLTEEFQKAQKSEGITIPDMTIGYMLEKSGISSYVITDTPGPDREGHVGAEKIARKAVRDTDMAIYAIDYVKHLTKDENKYLEWIVDEFDKNGKYYSLIFDVNRMDARYQDKQRKSVPRSLDFIRQELIKIDPRFKSCILFGTSALTYFDALVAPQIPGCEKLADENGLEALPELLEQYSAMNSGNDFGDFGDAASIQDDSSPKTILNFLSETITRLKVFHGIEAKSLEDLKDFSGMNSLLSYVGYVAQEKARTEKLHSLMRKIDQEYADIVNLFHFQELAEALARNRNKLEEAQKILKDFEEKVSGIFDPNFPEVLQLYKAGTIESDWILEYGMSYPFQLSAVKERVINDLKKSVDIQMRVRDLADNEMPAYLKEQYTHLQQNMPWSQKKTIYGRERVLLGAAQIEECYQKAAQQSAPLLKPRIQAKFKEAAEKLNKCNEPTRRDLEKIFKFRQKRLEEVVSDCSDRMLKHSIPFDVETPSFEFSFSGENLNLKMDIQFSPKNLDGTMGSLEKKLKNAPLKGTSKNFFSHLWDFFALAGKEETDIPPIYYDVDAFIREYRVKFSHHFVADLLALHFENSYQKELNAAIKVREDYFNTIERQMDAEQKQAESYTQRAHSMLDITRELDREKNAIKRKRTDLERIQRAFSGFRDSWNKIRPHS